MDKWINKINRRLFTVEFSVISLLTLFCFINCREDHWNVKEI